MNETLIGATSTDVLFGLSADECSMNCENRLTRLAGHILEQQSFYPMFPSPDKLHPQVCSTHVGIIILLSTPFYYYASFRITAGSQAV